MTGVNTGTKYFGGHSDLLCGVLVVKTIEEWKEVKFPPMVLDSLVSSRRRRTTVAPQPNIHGLYNGFPGIMVALTFA